jgi:RNA polymerase sigma-70 factor, ECF subfamily
MRETVVRARSPSKQTAIGLALGTSADREARWSALMAAAQSGDRIAYDRLLRETVPYIRSVIRVWHRAPDRVEDLAQEVLLAVHRVRHTYDPARPFLPWLGMIARCRALDGLRRTYRIAQFEVSEESAGAAYQDFVDLTVSDFGSAHAAADQLGKAIARLPETQREAIELLRLRTLSLAEASQLTGRSIGALKVNVHRALVALRRQLSAY